MAAALSCCDDLQCHIPVPTGCPKTDAPGANRPTAAASATTDSLPTATATTTRKRVKEQAIDM